MGWSWWALGNRPALFPVLACLAGVVFGPLAELPWFFWAVVCGLALIAAWTRASRPGGVLAGLLAALSLGAGLGELSADVPLPPIGVKVALEGRVETIGGQGFTLNVLHVDGVPMRFRAALSADRAPPVLAGQLVRVEARLKPIQEAANPGEWNRSEWSWRRGQPVTGSFSPARLVVLTPPAQWRKWLAGEHASLAHDTHALTADSTAAALLLTLSAGQRSELGDELEDAFARSGLAHVLSVSGLHVAVLAFSLFAVLRWLLTRRMHARLRLTDPRAFAVPLALPSVWAYVLFTGWQGPAVRSALMCSLVLGAWLVRRRSDPLNAVALAALVMLVIDPAAPFDLSTQLSFLAVAALVLLSPTIRAAIPVEPPSPSRQEGWRLRLVRWREAALQTFAASLAVTLTTAPLVLAAFQRVSLAGLVSNVITLPLSGVLTVVAAGGAALHVLLPTAAIPVLWVGIQLSKIFVFIAHTFAALPGSTAQLPAASGVLLACWWAGLVALVFFRGKARFFALATPAALLIHLAGPIQSDQLKVTFLAVGHGDAVVLSSQGHHALIDGGGVPQGHDTGRRFVLPFLRQQRIARLDLAVLSHAHPDHALGLITTLEELPTDRLWLPAEVGDGPLVDELIAAVGPAKIEEQEAGSESFRLGAARLEILGPPVDRSQLEGENDRSIVLLVRHGEVTFLLTGDVEAAGEAALSVGPVTVMKAPHHGSDTSSTAEFVEKSRPRHVVFCVGRRNRFDFPRADVVRRWRAVGATCHRTDVDGAITFTSDGRDVTVETFNPPGERRARRPVFDR
jgi:competence protein ComEC